MADYLYNRNKNYTINGCILFIDGQYINLSTIISFVQNGDNIKIFTAREREYSFRTARQKEFLQDLIDVINSINGFKNRIEI